MQKSQKKFMPIAYHEAGHAVVSRELHQFFSHLTIIPDNIPGSPGRFEAMQFDIDTFKPRGLHSLMSVRFQTEVMISLGGYAANRLKSKNTYHALRKDLEVVDGVVSWFTSNMDEAEAYRNWMWERTMSLMREPRRMAMLEKLAEALLQSGVMSGDSARQIMRQAEIEFAKQPK